MTKAFINADLLSKTRPIPPFSSIQLFHKKTCVHAYSGFGKLSLTHLFIKENGIA